MNDKIDALRPYIHHHSSDKRFCGSTLPMRQFSLKDADVTCPRCHAPVVSAQKEERMPNMKRWTDAKLDKELYFAEAADDGGPECADWNKRLVEECKRRGRVPPITLNPNWGRRGRMLENTAPGGF